MKVPDPFRQSVMEALTVAPTVDVTRLTDRIGFTQLPAGAFDRSVFPDLSARKDVKR